MSSLGVFSELFPSKDRFSATLKKYVIVFSEKLYSVLVQGKKSVLLLQQVWHHCNLRKVTQFTVGQE